MHSENKHIGGYRIFGWAIAVFLVLLFSYTAIHKIIAYDVFVFQMQLVPVAWMQAAAPLLGVAVPVAELAMVGLLIPDATRYSALVASLALMLAFEGYIIWMRATGLDLPCTCGGIISQMSWSAHTIFNALVILLVALALYIERPKEKNYEET